MLAEQVLYHLIHTSNPLYSGYFGDGVSQTVCQGWLQTTILPISTSKVAGIISGLLFDFSNQMNVSIDLILFFRS
jgi:hypothetical protein